MNISQEKKVVRDNKRRRGRRKGERKERERNKKRVVMYRAPAAAEATYVLCHLTLAKPYLG